MKLMYSIFNYFKKDRSTFWYNFCWYFPTLLYVLANLYFIFYIFPKMVDINDTIFVDIIKSWKNISVIFIVYLVTFPFFPLFIKTSGKIKILSKTKAKWYKFIKWFSIVIGLILIVAYTQYRNVFVIFSLLMLYILVLNIILYFLKKDV